METVVIPICIAGLKVSISFCKVQLIDLLVNFVYQHLWKFRVERIEVGFFGIKVINSLYDVSDDKLS